ncbi:hypothetical protein [uncultured Oxalicibacterium sp.]|uniref:hypothetical protein n=1 Tax=uncultured Oxalicibacterium sp. TaxID=1168540 RepID=UPI0025EECF0C|nr:hypothetical protein [uncultured Oxalicibacterium sp.]
MRRFIVICLILLLPLQVFADVAEEYPPAYAVASETQGLDISCPFSSTLAFSSCQADSGKMLPGHLDFADILIPAPALAMTRHHDRTRSCLFASFIDSNTAPPTRPPPFGVARTSTASRLAHAMRA